MSRKVRLFAVLMIVALSFVALPNSASAYCNRYTNSELAEIDGIYTCAYTGDGCSSCFNYGTRGGGSYDLCYFDYHTSDLACFYYL